MSKRRQAMGGLSMEERAWLWAYRWAGRNGYGYEDDGVDSPERDAEISRSIHEQRMIAMAYSMGWTNGRRRALAEARASWASFERVMKKWGPPYGGPREG